ncbi:hypothetical protein CCAX7_38180 [Capsulimonas corticalis]|uniref:Uncharacterized protein n=1 Tax=Capsulimonas corticalis TaxID=2219043 RepID=A0A402D109_9BACT|nr:helix-turn-helix domain-containing protein [Capsulimonas corticalis]BDI31767.1 hypothetical protein CCAX7_38180 [Capsulimonas corticalis]
MDTKTKDTGKTKDAIKQLQAEMRALQAALTASREAPTAAAPEPAARREKGDGVVAYSVSYRTPGEGETKVKNVSESVTSAQIARVSDERVATIGDAVSSAPKVSLLRALLGKEGESAAVLGEIASLSTGSLYHHLRDLMHAGLINQTARNRYALTDHGNRVLLVLLALAVAP